MHYVYLLQSVKDNRTYVGYTSNLNKRLREHKAGRVRATKHRMPLKLLFFEEFELSQEAKKREKWWKNGAGRRKLRSMYKNYELNQNDS